jgi:hypothetical protein
MILEIARHAGLLFLRCRSIAAFVGVREGDDFVFSSLRLWLGRHGTEHVGNLAWGNPSRAAQAVSIASAMIGGDANVPTRSSGVAARTS